MDLASVVAALASVGVRVSGSTPNNNIQEDSSRACPTGLAGPEPSGTHNDPGQHFQRPSVFWWILGAKQSIWPTPMFLETNSPKSVNPPNGGAYSKPIMRRLCQGGTSK